MIKDGSSNTIVVSEAVQPVEWTRPADIQVSPSQPIQLGVLADRHSRSPDGDGSVASAVHSISRSCWPIDPADGNPIPDFEGPPGKK